MREKWISMRYPFNCFPPGKSFHPIGLVIRIFISANDSRRQIFEQQEIFEPFIGLFRKYQATFHLTSFLGMHFIFSLYS